MPARYMEVLISQEKVNHKLLSFKENLYSLGASQLYIPAISSVLDLYLRVIQNVGRYYTIVNTFPLPSVQVKLLHMKKIVTMIVINGVYHQVVNRVNMDHLKNTLLKNNQLKIKKQKKKK